MFELLTRAVMDDRERELERMALQNLAIKLNPTANARRRTWPFQRASRASSATFAAGHSASSIE